MNKLFLKQHETLSKFRLISLYFATALVIFSLLGIFSKGLNLGLDFTGGYLTEFTTQESLTQQNMETLLSSYLPDSFSLKSAENVKILISGNLASLRNVVSRGGNGFL